MQMSLYAHRGFEPDRFVGAGSNLTLIKREALFVQASLLSDERGELISVLRRVLRSDHVTGYRDKADRNFRLCRFHITQLSISYRASKPTPLH